MSVSAASYDSLRALCRKNNPAPDDWRRFVCVEPDTRENYVLAPGETRTMEMALEVQ